MTARATAVDLREARRVIDKLRALRLDQGLSVRVAAREAGMSPSRWLSIESSPAVANQIHLTTLDAMARALGHAVTMLMPPDAMQIATDAARPKLLLLSWRGDLERDEWEEWAWIWSWAKEDVWALLWDRADRQFHTLTPAEAYLLCRWFALETASQHPTGGVR